MSAPTEGRPLVLVLLEVLLGEPKAHVRPADPSCLHSSPATLVSIFLFSGEIN